MGISDKFANLSWLDPTLGTVVNVANGNLLGPIGNFIKMANKPDGLEKVEDAYAAAEICKALLPKVEETIDKYETEIEDINDDLTAKLARIEKEQKEEDAHNKEINKQIRDIQNGLSESPTEEDYGEANAEIENLQGELLNTDFSAETDAVQKNGQNQLDAKLKNALEVTKNAKAVAAETLEAYQEMADTHVSNGFFIKVSGAREEQKKVADAGKAAVNAASKLKAEAERLNKDGSVSDVEESDVTTQKKEEESKDK